MEIILELIFEVLFVVIAEALGEIFLEMGFYSISSALTKKRRANKVISIVGLLLLGAII